MAFDLITKSNITSKLPLVKYENIDVTTKPVTFNNVSINALNNWKPNIPLIKSSINKTPTIQVPDLASQFSTNNTYKDQLNQLLSNVLKQPISNHVSQFSKLGSWIPSLGSVAVDAGINLLTDKLFDTDSELGRGLGTIFSSGVSSATNTVTNNILKGTSLMDGLSKNVGASLAGAGAGIAGNLIGKGINSLGGDSMLSRGLGQGISTAIGGFGGQVLSNLARGNAALQGFTGITKAGLTVIGAKATADAINAGKSTIEAMKAGQTAANAAKFASWANIGGLAGTAVGMGLQAAFGPSKEYGGKYGNITLTADTIYDIALTGISFAGPVGAIIGGGMALNKGLSNVFGSTDGMTKTDAILGSAWMPAPVKWVNMWGSSKTGDFFNLSWQNSMKANSFMGNAFGDLGDRFQRAREEANKTYGTFSHGAKKEALDNIDFANSAWGKILAMADLNEYQNIRSQYMSSINNLRYAQNIQGGWTPLYRGKQGMKIFNNATNHNMGMRLLSAAALIDNKQMILCSAVD